LIDLYRESGLYPMNAAYAKCFRRGGPVSEKNPDPDNLHPNTEGHRRLAKTIAARLLTLPSDFKAP
ncbi:MAG: SGNH/GDSL hydrolase family protein, partial [Kiritimatiellae bacterium]|nr:SGNH/GDSL hydrolase family protein [Kiritimatiellia bacterium]